MKILFEGETMVKKFLLSAAVVGALATSAMAYNVDELKNMSSGIATAGTPIFVPNNTNPLANGNIGFDQTQLSNTLIFPAFFVGNGYETTIRVINPDPNHAVVAKVVLYDGKDSHEVRDFNIYLSANDVWVGHIKVDSNGVKKIISTDDSTPLEDGSLASTDKPFSKSINSNFGYIEVIAMAVTDGKSGAHGDHAGLRKAYGTFAKVERTGSVNPNIVFTNGVIKNKVATTPYVKLKTSLDANNNNITVSGFNAYLVDSDNDNKYDSTKEYAFTAPIVNGSFLGLTGDVRITDTVNGKDMDMMPYKINYPAQVTNNNNKKVPASLVYIEGEKANIADLFIGNKNIGNKNTNIYDATSLQNEITAMSNTNYYVTYGDAKVGNMALILTNPFKRVYVQAALDEADAGVDGEDGVIKPKTKITDNNINPVYYQDASVDDKGNINYGSTKVIAQFFNESEGMMSAGQFSPATTPTIKLTNEVAQTGVDVNNQDDLGYYLNQAVNTGYERGFITLLNVNGTNTKIPGIMTQMLATTAGGKVVTNWIVPQGK
jgi:hypothetical protein